MQSKYLKSPQEFYNELLSQINGNDSHKVLSTLLRMGLANVNISRIVSGDAITDNEVVGTPLYVVAKDKDVAILQHMKEFGAIIPDNIHIPAHASPRPAALTDNKMFAQHFVVRRTKEGKDIFNNRPACTGFVYEYARFNMTPHHRNINEDFLDKLLRELHEHSENFYQRIYHYQENAEHAISSSRVTNVKLVELKGILEVYNEELRSAHIVQVSIGFDKMGHNVAIRKLVINNEIKYQLFDPTYYDGEVLTADQLNKRFNDHIKNYTDNWQWGEVQEYRLGDIGKHLHRMGHLQTRNNKFPFKNLHLLIRHLNAKNMAAVNDFITGVSLTRENINVKYSVGTVIDKYLWNRNKDSDFKKTLLLNLSDEHFLLVAESMFKEDITYPEHLFSLFLNDKLAVRLPEKLRQTIIELKQKSDMQANPSLLKN